MHRSTEVARPLIEEKSHGFGVCICDPYVEPAVSVQIADSDVERSADNIVAGDPEALTRVAVFHPVIGDHLTEPRPVPTRMRSAHPSPVTSAAAIARGAAMMPTWLCRTNDNDCAETAGSRSLR